MCIEGEVTIWSDKESIQLRVGESMFISHDTKSYQYKGKGKLARAYN
ncbi:hypothetical protein [Vibrio harveyi]